MRHLITEPCDGYPEYEPNEEDWLEFYDYVQQVEEQEERERFEEANFELLTIEPIF